MKNQAKGDYILLRATSRPPETKSGIILSTETNLETAKPSKDQRRLIDKVEVVSIGKDVKDVKVGDCIYPQGFVYNQKIPAGDINKKHQPEKEVWLWAKEEHIILVIK